MYVCEREKGGGILWYIDTKKSHLPPLPLFPSLPLLPPSPNWNSTYSLTHLCLFYHVRPNPSYIFFFNSNVRWLNLTIGTRRPHPIQQYITPSPTHILSQSRPSRPTPTCTHLRPTHNMIFNVKIDQDLFLKWCILRQGPIKSTIAEQVNVKIIICFRYLGSFVRRITTMDEKLYRYQGYVSVFYRFFFLLLLFFILINIVVIWLSYTNSAKVWSFFRSFK